jgi:hypothetical protein
VAAALLRSFADEDATVSPRLGADT